MCWEQKALSVNWTLAQRLSWQYTRMCWRMPWLGPFWAPWRAGGRQLWGAGAGEVQTGASCVLRQAWRGASPCHLLFVCLHLLPLPATPFPFLHRKGKARGTEMCLVLWWMNSSAPSSRKGLQFYPLSRCLWYLSLDETKRSPKASGGTAEFHWWLSQKSPNLARLISLSKCWFTRLRCLMFPTRLAGRGSLNTVWNLASFCLISRPEYIRVSPE